VRKALGAGLLEAIRISVRSGKCRRLSLSETTWVLRHSYLAIGNDCGPMHIAAGVQTRLIILFGPSCEVKNGPLYKGVPLSVPVPCRPCQYGELLLSCNDPRCMNELIPSWLWTKSEGRCRPGHQRQDRA
jgi:ADP-heptose:LPS heptosyltransferase